ncbi:hypothetical protein L9F63_004048, partial [Diploptera punctata]
LEFRLLVTRQFSMNMFYFISTLSLANNVCWRLQSSPAEISWLASGYAYFCLCDT